jgi:hypothetical protein
MSSRKAADMIARFVFLLIFLITVLSGFSLQAGTESSGWLERIAAQLIELKYGAVRAGSAAAYDLYLTQVHDVRKAFNRKDIQTVRKEMNRLIELIAVRKGEITEAEARTLLLFIGIVTPIEYLEDWAKDRLRLLSESLNEPAMELPTDAPFGIFVESEGALARFESWLAERFHPIVILGYGVLALTVLSAVVLLVVVLRRSKDGRDSIEVTRCPDAPPRPLSQRRRTDAA